MSDQIVSVGQRVEKICQVCDQQLGHVVKTVTKLGKISRVTCSKCGRVGMFKKSGDALKLQNLAGKTGAPYDRKRTYRVGQVLEHTNFGKGEVMTVFGTKMIDVLFLDRVRRLIHSRI